MSKTINPLYEKEDLNKATAANLDVWLLNLQNRVDQLEKSNNIKDTKISELETEIITLKANSTTTAGASTSSGNFAWSNLFKNNTSTNESVAVLVAKIAHENKDKERIDKFIIVSGVTECDSVNEDEKKHHDEEKLNEILTTLEINKTEVKQFSRLKVNPSRPPTNKDPALIRLEFKTKETQLKAIKESKNLKGSETTKNIYINPDKTALERLTEKKLREERNKRNASLENVAESEGSEGRQRFGVDANSKKFYWGIRWGILKRVFIA